jgi:hypothetical protein
MLGISRWTEKGGSYRTVQRYFQTTIWNSPDLVVLPQSDVVGELSGERF